MGEAYEDCKLTWIDTNRYVISLQRRNLFNSQSIDDSWQSGMLQFTEVGRLQIHARDYLFCLDGLQTRTFQNDINFFVRSVCYLDCTWCGIKFSLPLLRWPIACCHKQVVFKMKKVQPFFLKKIFKNDVTFFYLAVISWSSGTIVSYY